MSEILDETRNFLKQEKLDYILVNSTNEFLVEYNSLEKNSRYLLTGFSGSTGDALVSPKDVFLFVDGRYHTQADLEVNKKDVTVVKLQITDKIIDAISDKIEKNSVLGICSKKNSQFRYENMIKKFKEKNITIKLLDTDKIEKKLKITPQHITRIPIELCGKTTDEKIKELTQNLQDNEAILITNIEELSYIYNMRNFEKENSCSMEGKAIFTKSQNLLFKDETLNDFDEYIENSNNIETFFVDKKTISAHDYLLVKNKSQSMNFSPVNFTKCIKTYAEIEHYKEAFRKTDLALSATKKFIEENNNISEYDIKENLEENFRKNGAISQSFTSIIAKDANSALAHYSKSSPNEIVKDSSLILIDCGGYYDGGLATDITRVFVKGKPTKEQKTVYTTVLKAFLRAYNTTDFQCGEDIDKVAREFLNKNAPSGYVFNHGLGHGIGVSVHESPPRLSTGTEESKMLLKDNMCFTIEPGLYKEGAFGVRLENSCYLHNGRIKSFTNMCYEKKLIDYSMLNEQEKEWLKDFEVN